MKALYYARHHPIAPRVILFASSSSLTLQS